MKCPECGDSVYESDDVCMSCGHDLIPPKKRHPRAISGAQRSSGVPGRFPVAKVLRAVGALFVCVCLLIGVPLHVSFDVIPGPVSSEITFPVGYVLGVICALFIIVRYVIWPFVSSRTNPQDNIIQAIQESSVRVSEPKRERPEETGNDR